MKMLPVIALLALAGCTASPARFDRGSTDAAQFERERYECERDAKGIRRADTCDELEMYERCMRSKGYKEIPDSASKGLCTRVF